MKRQLYDTNQTNAQTVDSHWSISARLCTVVCRLDATTSLQHVEVSTDVGHCGPMMSGLEIRVDRWPESTKNPVGPPNRVRQWSSGLPKLCQRTLHLLAFFITFAVAVTTTLTLTSNGH